MTKEIIEIAHNSAIINVELFHGHDIKLDAFDTTRTARQDQVVK